MPYRTTLLCNVKKNMSSPKNIQSEMKYINIFMKFFNLFPDDLSASFYKKIFFSIVQKVVLMVLIILFIHYLFALVYSLLKINEVLQKILMLNTYFLSILAIYATLYVMIFHRKNFLLLWLNIFRFENNFKALEMHANIDKKINVIVALTPFIIHSLFHSIWYTNFTPPNTYTLCLPVTSLTVIYLRMVEMVWRLQYLYLLSLFKNYYKQLNNLLKDIWRLNCNERVILLHNISKCHQEMYDIIKLYGKILNIKILTELAKASLYLFLEFYYFFKVYFESNLYANISIILLYIFHSCLAILSIIVPAFNCCIYVSHP